MKRLAITLGTAALALMAISCGDLFGWVPGVGDDHPMASTPDSTRGDTVFYSYHMEISHARRAGGMIPDMMLEDHTWKLATWGGTWHVYFAEWSHPEINPGFEYWYEPTAAITLLSRAPEASARAAIPGLIAAAGDSLAEYMGMIGPPDDLVGFYSVVLDVPGSGADQPLPADFDLLSVLDSYLSSELIDGAAFSPMPSQQVTSLEDLVVIFADGTTEASVNEVAAAYGMTVTDHHMVNRAMYEMQVNDPSIATAVEIAARMKAERSDVVVDAFAKTMTVAAVLE